MCTSGNGHALVLLRGKVVWAGRRLTRKEVDGRLVADANIDLTKLVPEVHLVAINRERGRADL